MTFANYTLSFPVTFTKTFSHHLLYWYPYGFCYSENFALTSDILLLHHLTFCLLPIILINSHLLPSFFFPLPKIASCHVTKKPQTTAVKIMTAKK